MASFGVTARTAKSTDWTYCFSCSSDNQLQKKCLPQILFGNFGFECLCSKRKHVADMLFTGRRWFWEWLGNREPPDVGLAPTAVWRVALIPPIATGGPFPDHSPSLPPSPSLFPPTLLALFAMLQEVAAQAGVGEGSLSCKGWRGRAVQAALGARPTSGGAQGNFSNFGILPVLTVEPSEPQTAKVIQK